MKQEAEKVPFDDAIKSHKKMGIQTYTFTTECKKQCLLKQPTIIQSGKIMPFLIPIGEKGTKTYQEPDFNSAAILLVNECWIAGNDEIRKSEELKLEVGLAALNLVEMKTAKIKKN